MDLTIYDIIQGPIVTEKAFDLNKRFKKLVLQVHPEANKQQVAEALQKLFNVKVEKINVIVRRGKRISFQRRETWKSSTKRVIVTLKEGYAIDVLDQSQATVTDAQDALNA